MKIESIDRGGVFVLCPRGLLTGADAEVLRSHLDELAANPASEIVLDCSGLRFVDSRGLEVLVEAAEQFIRSGRTLRLAACTATLREVLE